MNTRTFGHIIGGKEVHSPATFESRNASRHVDLVAIFAEATLDQVRDACVAARLALAGWRRTPAPVRGVIIGQIGRAIEREKESLSRLMSREMGKTLKEARGDVQEAIDTCHFFQSEGRRLYGQTVPSEMRNKELMTYRRPLGVVGVITAGNFPVAVPSWKLIPALLTGNTIVWKPSEDAPATAFALARLFEEGGLPDGVLNVVFGGGAGAAGEFLVEMLDERRLDKIAFTGSTAVGRHIGAIAGRNLTHPTLELGGKNPMIVMRDADVDNAVAGALWAAFGTAGQRCTSLGNLILDEPIANAFRTKFLAAVAEIKIGDPALFDDILYGPFINERFFHAWDAHYGWGRADGATLAYGQGRITETHRPPGFRGDPAAGLYGWPTVWTDVRPGMRIFQTEVFGPTVNLITVNGIDEAIDVANSVDYGLSSAIYTQNRMWAFQFKETIQAGMSSINNSTTGAEAHMPFGGIKASGNGTRESGIWVLDNYTYWHGVNDELSGRLQLAQMDTEYGQMRAPYHVAPLADGS